MSDYLGFGLGLRSVHYDTILKTLPKNVDWFEIISENFMIEGGKPLFYLDKIREHYPIVMHGVSLSIAGNHPIDLNYLKRLKQLIQRISPAWVSDHLAWTRHSAHQFHDLLPFPYTHSMLNYIAERVDFVQNFLQMPIALENPSTYLSFEASEMSEQDFIAKLCQKTGCKLLLDINNIFVSCHNNQWDSRAYLQAIPKDFVIQHHLAGHSTHNESQLLIDTHDAPIVPDVWSLYREAVSLFGKVSTMIERDDNIPALEELLNELDFARHIAQNALQATH